MEVVEIRSENNPGNPLKISGTVGAKEIIHSYLSRSLIWWTRPFPDSELKNHSKLPNQTQDLDHKWGEWRPEAMLPSRGCP